MFHVLNLLPFIVTPESTSQIPASAVQTPQVRRGCVRLKGALVGIDDEDDSTFTITVDNKTFHFQAKDSEERERWIRALEDTVVRHNTLAR